MKDYEFQLGKGEDGRSSIRVRGEKVELQQNKIKIIVSHFYFILK